MLSKKGLTELAKSFGRFMYFGLLGLLAAFLVALSTNADLLQSTITVGGVTLPAGVYLAAGAGFLAKAIDRYRHASDKTRSNGIAPGFLQK